MQDFHPWLPLAKNIIKASFFKHPGSVSLYTLLFSMAAREETVTEDQPIMVGQLRTNYGFLCEFFGVSLQTIRTCMSKLKKANAIYVDGSHKHYMLVTVRHFNDFIFSAAANQGGWVKFYVEVTNYSWFRDSVCATVYIDILCKCYSTDKDENYNLSLSGIVRDTGINCTKVISSILRLQRENVINVGYKKGRDLMGVSFLNGGLCLPAPVNVRKLQHTSNIPTTYQQHTANISSDNKNMLKDNGLNNRLSESYEVVQHTANIPLTYQQHINEGVNISKLEKKSDSLTIKDKDIDKDNINIINNNTRARVRDFLLADGDWKYCAMENLGIKDDETFRKYLDQFLRESVANGKDHGTIAEYKSHFMSWYRNEKKRSQAQTVSAKAKAKDVDHFDWTYKPLTEEDRQKKFDRERWNYTSQIERYEKGEQWLLKSLLEHYNDGTLKRYGIDWQPPQDKNI